MAGTRKRKAGQSQAERGRGTRAGAPRDGASTTDPWADERGTSVEAPGIGKGFATFQKVKERLRGVVLKFFPTRFGEAVAVKLTEVPTCEVWRTDDDLGTEEKLSPAVGDIVNIGLNNVDLKAKLTHKFLGQEVGIWLDGHQETENGTMKVYGVKVFETESQDNLPF